VWGGMRAWVAGWVVWVAGCAGGCTVACMGWVVWHTHGWAEGVGSMGGWECVVAGGAERGAQGVWWAGVGWGGCVGGHGRVAWGEVHDEWRVNFSDYITNCNE